VTTTTRTRKRSARTAPGRKLLQHDRSLGVRYVAGVDEAGRGCLAGPIVASAVVLDMERLVGPDAAGFAKLTDSKQVAPAERARLLDVVLRSATAVATTSITAAEIDRRGLHNTNLHAFRRVVGGLRCPIDLVLLDGFDVDGIDFPRRRIVKGDATSAAIAAASIVAKQTRDALMERMDERFDGRWQFAEHAGYATPEHHERIRVHGISPVHRLSFESSAYADAPMA
jgi:ribonuclease HII